MGVVTSRAAPNQKLLVSAVGVIRPGMQSGPKRCAARYSTTSRHRSGAKHRLLRCADLRGESGWHQFWWAGQALEIRSKRRPLSAVLTTDLRLCRFASAPSRCRSKKRTLNGWWVLRAVAVLRRPPTRRAAGVPVHGREVVAPAFREAGRGTVSGCACSSACLTTPHQTEPVVCPSVARRADARVHRRRGTVHDHAARW